MGSLAVRGEQIKHSLNSLVNALEKTRPAEAWNGDSGEFQELDDFTDALSEMLAYYSPGNPSPADGLFGDEKFRELMEQMRDGLKTYDTTHRLRDVIPKQYADYFDQKGE